MIIETSKDNYTCLLIFCYVMRKLNPDSISTIKSDKEEERFICYFIAFGACIWKYSYMKKVISSMTYFYEKYEDVLLSAIVQDTTNHIYLITFCRVKGECDVF